MRSDRADFQGDAACFVWSFGEMTKIENVEGNDESPAGVYKSTGLNDHHVWCANGFTSASVSQRFGVRRPGRSPRAVDRRGLGARALQGRRVDFWQSEAHR